MSAPTVDALDCAHAPTENSGIGTGYAITSDGKRVCYGCADALAAAAIFAAHPGDRFTFYVSTDGRDIVSWSGGVLMRDVRYGKIHPWSRRRPSCAEARYYLTAVDPKRRVWSGTGTAGEWSTLKLTGSVRP